MNGIGHTDLADSECGRFDVSKRNQLHFFRVRTLTEEGVQLDIRSELTRAHDVVFLGELAIVSSIAEGESDSDILNSGLYEVIVGNVGSDIEDGVSQGRLLERESSKQVWELMRV